MAKCFQCGKSFDYEKYYGICPKCGAYNRENAPEPEGQMPQQDGRQYGSGATGKASSAGTAVFVLLLLGLVCSIAMPPLYLAGTALRGPSGHARGQERQKEGTVPSFPEQEAEAIIQEPEEPCLLGKNCGHAVVVSEAWELVPAGMVEAFPPGEKLVAVAVSYANTEQGYSAYSVLDMLYAGYGEHTFKECMNTYDMEEYQPLLGGRKIVDNYNITYGDGEGVILFFVPEDTKQISLYLESRDEGTSQLLAVYQIPLEIKKGQELNPLRNKSGAGNLRRGFPAGGVE